MKIHLIAILAGVFLLQGCVSIQNTASLSLNTTTQSISLIEALNKDGLHKLANYVSEHEEMMFEACEKTNDVIFEKLETGEVSFNTFLNYLFGKLNLGDCQKAARKVKVITDEIIKIYPKYSKFTIRLPTTQFQKNNRENK